MGVKYKAVVAGINLDCYDLNIIIKTLHKRGKKMMKKVEKRKMASNGYIYPDEAHDHFNIAHLFLMCLDTLEKEGK